MRRPTALALVLTIAIATATACGGTSKLSADADVTITGTVHDPDDQPLPNTPVVLANEVDFGEAVLGLTFVAASLGTACLAEPAPAICSKARRTTTDGEGRYRFTLKGSDTQGLVGTASTFHLSVGTPGTGPSVSARFQIQRASLDVPPLRLWAPDVQLTVGRTIRAAWPQRDPSATERVVFYAGSNTSSNIVWTAEGRSPITIDGRLLEDTRGTATVESDATEEADGARFRITHQSARADIATTPVPPSRDTPCTPEPCPVTDGNLGPPTNAPPPDRHEVTVDLTRSTTPTLIVVRGCPAHCDIETSVDGLSYKVVGSSKEPFFTVTPVLGTPVRYVRVKSISDLNRLAEVSVWLAN